VVVETNAVFRADSVTPVLAGPIPERIYPLIARNAGAQAQVVKAGIERNLDLAFDAFCNDPLVDIPVEDAKKLFDEMIDNTKKYLEMYEIK
jgi:alpha-galactosidase